MFLYLIKTTTFNKNSCLVPHDSMRWKMRKVTVSIGLLHSLGCQQTCQPLSSTAASGGWDTCRESLQEGHTGWPIHPSSALCIRKRNKLIRHRRFAFPHGTAHKLSCLCTCKKFFKNLTQDAPGKLGCGNQSIMPKSGWLIDLVECCHLV